MKKLAITLLLGFTAQTVFANTMFSCQTNNGKQLSLTLVADSFEYKFGKPNKTELTFKNKIRDIFSREETYSSVGTGYFDLSIEMLNGKYSYIITRSEARNSSTIEAGVEVFKNGKSLAMVECHPKTVYESEVLFDLMRSYDRSH